MKKYTLSPWHVPFATHLFVAVIGAMATISISTWNPALILAVALALILFVAYLASRYSQQRISNGIEIIENAVINCEKPPGDSEFCRAAENVASHVTRLAAVAAKGQEQSREVETLLTAFDRRVSQERKPSPARQLSMLLKSLGSEAQGYIEGIATLGAEMQFLREQLNTASKNENQLVRAAAGEVSKLASGITDTTNHAKLARASDVTATEETESVHRHLLTLQQQLETLREQIGGCDKKSLSLRDQTVEIASLMQTIHEYSSKTDTMALNASIESVRAGEHGRQFAAAADEIRKLTNIISDSTRDAMDRLKLIEGSADDMTSICSQGSATIELQMGTSHGLSRSLSEIRQSTNQSRVHIDQVLETAETQLQNLNVVAGALGGIFESAERSIERNKEENVKRTELSDELVALSGLLLPLTGAQHQLDEPSSPPVGTLVASADLDLEYAQANG